MKIFYSWQSDSESKFNRGFIKDALEKAIKEINRDFDVYEADRELTIDHDTKDVPGTPDLAGTIFEKISSCTIFVADISFVATGFEKNRKVANPNVLLELGYAFARLGNDRVLCVLNSASGKVEDLPFDLNHKRHPIQYCLKADSEDKELQKKQLVTDLKTAIKAIVKVEKFKAIPVELSDHPSRENIFDAIMSSDSTDDWSSAGYDNVGGSESMFFKKNVNLRFVSGHDEKFVQQSRFTEAWANKHPDPNAKGYYIQLYFASSHISDFVFVSVDGGRALLPLPKSAINLEVSSLNYKIAQIHDKFGTLDEYMAKSQLKISGKL